MTYQVQSPVAIIAFNRPDAVRQVLASVSKVKPKTLYVITDGPRIGHPDDIKKCRQVRELLGCIDWECNVEENCAEHNLGCFRRVSSGISWAFSKTEKLIILEDDTVPNVSFFRFCDEILERYKDDSRVMSISGSNTDGKWQRDQASYFFSPSGGIWGWATWKRAWQFFDPQMKLWADQRVRTLLRQVHHKKTIWHYRYISFEQQYRKLLKNTSTAWGYQWGLAGLVQSGLCVVPSVNLISNVGHSKDATHTSEPNSYFGKIPCYEIDFPLVHPDFMIPDMEFYRRRWTRLLTGGKSSIGLWVALRTFLQYLYLKIHPK